MRPILKIRCWKLRRESNPVLPDCVDYENSKDVLSTDELKSAEQVLIKSAQAESFSKEIEVLSLETLLGSIPLPKKNDIKNSRLYRLDRSTFYSFFSRQLVVITLYYKTIIPLAFIVYMIPIQLYHSLMLL